MALTRRQIDDAVYGIGFWLKRWYGNPLAYVIECIGDVPTHQQAEILKAFRHHQFVAVKSGHGIGKSKLTSWLVNWWLDTRGKRAPITGAGGDQLNNVVWPEVIASCNKKMEWLANQYEHTTSELRLKSNPENCRAILRTARADNDDALQGFHDCMYFIDEGSGVRDGIFEVAAGAMGDPASYAFMDGNPVRLSGYMYSIFHRKTRWYCMSFSSEDSLTDEEYSYTYVDPKGNIRIIKTHGRQTRKWIEDMRLEYGLTSNTYKTRVLGEFANLARDQVVEQRWFENIKYGSNLSERVKKGIRRMGIDPAWTGEDDTGVVIREGNTILHATSWHGADIVESFQRAKQLFDEWNCDFVHVDTVGVGAGIFDMFMHAINKGRIGYPAIKVMASESAPVDHDGVCLKLRDWLWWKARKFFRSKLVVYAGHEDSPAWIALRDELAAPTYAIQTNGSIRVESKDDMKKRGMHSPNIADALNLTFYGDYEIFRENYVTQKDISMRNGIKKRQKVLNWKTM